MNKRGSCFIATAAYGHPMANEITELCDYRDNTMIKNLFGRCFIKIYYKVSPPLAKIISKSPFLRRITRVILKPFINHAQRINAKRID